MFRRRIRQLWRLINIPPHQLVVKVYRRLVGAFRDSVNRRRDGRRVSYLPLQGALLSARLQPFSAENFCDHFGQSSGEILLRFCRRSMEHRFDLLGSGWVQVRYGAVCAGLNGHHYQGEEEPCLRWDSEGEWLRGRINGANLVRSQTIWKLVDSGYVPIDWQRDFKSGYRWDELTWSGDIRLGHLPGVDVKVPWELARMQHLPQMALAFYWLKNCAADDVATRELQDSLCAEFRNQILDFMATNPPRFGVNWQCTMDVGIRVANWLLAWDLLVLAGAEFDDLFLEQFAASVNDHAVHIWNHLESDGAVRGNHYLANIAGLLFAAAYLPGSDAADRWLSFAVRELLAEVDGQFFADGSNFEGSVCYHRLSAEMVAWCSALVGGLGDERRSVLNGFEAENFTTLFSRDHFAKLQRMAEFSIHATKPNGQLHQVGDNDSGRFFNLLPELVAGVAESSDVCLQDDFLQEELLGSRPFVAAVAGLFDRNLWSDFCGGRVVETLLVRSFVGGREHLAEGVVDRSRTVRVERVADLESYFSSQKESVSASSLQQVSSMIALPFGVTLVGADCFAYPDFGLFIWRTARCYLAIRCGVIGQNGIGGHAHNDQLSVELQVDGDDWMADGGSYLYTPDAVSRNLYRSVSAHFAPQIVGGDGGGCEPGRLDRGLFRIDGCLGGDCLHFSDAGFVGQHSGYGAVVTRLLRIGEQRIEIHDFVDVSKGADAGMTLQAIPSIDAEHWWKPPVPFSPGYGRQSGC